MSLGSQLCDCTFLTKRTWRWSRRCFFNFFLLFVTVVHPPLAPDSAILAQLVCATGATGRHAYLLGICAVPLGTALLFGQVEIPPTSCLSVYNTVITSFMSCVSRIRSFLISSTSARKDRTSFEQAAAVMASLGTYEAFAIRSPTAYRRALSCMPKAEFVSVFCFFGLNSLVAYACCPFQFCDLPTRKSGGEGRCWILIGSGASPRVSDP